MLEKYFQRKVIRYARDKGWMVFHEYNSKFSCPGFPDLVMVRGGKLMFVELKTDIGQLSKEQIDWMSELWQCGVDCRMWTPRRWQEIVKALE